MSVLFASSEIYPYAKSGGLADVADALPEALKKSINISRVMPLYSFMDVKKFKLYTSYSVKIATIVYDIEVFSLKKNEITSYFIKAPHLSTTEMMYGSKESDYENNDLRFALFSMAIVKLAQELDIKVLHLNDWHTALAALYVKEFALNIRVIFTIHNLAYQGLFDEHTLCKIGLNKKYFHLDALEFYNKVNFLKAGIAYSDVVTTVSPTYAKEILTREFGCGLDGFLNYHKEKLYGILNGINVTRFNASKDKMIVHNYDRNSLEKKHDNKIDFIQHSTLKDPRKPLFVMVARLVQQKGISLILDSFEELVSQNINLFILGEGDKTISQKFTMLALQHSNFEYFDGYDEALSHKTYAAADFVLIPSIFEPCGLTQLIAMEYGAIPIVHAVGGLKDSVYEDGTLCGEGIVYENQSREEFLFAIQRALKLKKNGKKLKKKRVHNMGCDFSFTPSALEYLKLYKSEL